MSRSIFLALFAIVAVSHGKPVSRDLKHAHPLDGHARVFARRELKDSSKKAVFIELANRHGYDLKK